MTDVEKLLVRIGTARDAISEKPDQTSLDYMIDGVLMECFVLLKEQEEREKAICKGICEFIRGSCSTDTYEDKEYVCHVIQQMFVKGSW